MIPVLSRIPERIPLAGGQAITSSGPLLQQWRGANRGKD